MDVRLDGKVALITGASRGIGFAIAEAMAGAGASVMLSSRKEGDLASAADAIAGRVRHVAANAGDPDAAQMAVDETMERFGRIDVLVNNAATNPHLGPTLDIELAAFDKTVQVNWRAPLVWTRLAWDRWMRDEGGVVLNVASIGAQVAEGGIGVYNGTKAAVLHLTRQLASEMAPQVRVNSISPGLVKTDMARALWEPNEEGMARHVPLARLGEPADIGQAAVFLCSDAASWITGTDLVVDGGMLLR